MGLKIGIFASHLRICVLRSTLKKLDVLFLIFSSLFPIEFFVSGSFSIELKYLKKNFNKLNKKNKMKKKKKLKKKKVKPCF